MKQALSLWVFIERNFVCFVIILDIISCLIVVTFRIVRNIKLPSLAACLVGGAIEIVVAGLLVTKEALFLCVD